MTLPTDNRPAIFDADGHIFEDDDQMIEYYEGEHAITRRNKALPIFPGLDGWARGVIHEREDNTAGRYSHTDAEVWNTLLGVLNAEGSVLYPTAGLACGLMQDVNFATATATAYNNWLEDRYTAKDKRLFGVGMICVENVEASVKEIVRCATERTGFVAMMMPTVTATPIKFGDKRYWPIFEAAEAHNMAIALHGGPSAGIGVDFQRPFAKVHTMSHPYPLMLQATDMIWEGVFDAFPKLRVAFLEAGASWVPFLMDRLDTEFDSIFGTDARGRLERRPSEYFKSDNFWVTAELAEPGLKYAIDAIGPDRIMYASDFPHEPTEDELTGAVPEFLRRGDIADDAKAKILGSNARNFYGLNGSGQAASGGSNGAEQIATLETRIAELERELASARNGGSNGGSNGAAPSIQTGANHTGAVQAIATQKMPYAVETGALAKKVAWCACGRSANQPYCDGSHKGTGLSPVVFDAEAGRTLYLCGCRQSGNKPFCDGSHKKL